MAMIIRSFGHRFGLSDAWAKLQDLIPENLNEEAMGYTSRREVASTHHIWFYSAKTKDHVTIKDVLKFFVQYMKNDQLGMIANAHLGFPILTEKLKQKLWQTTTLIGWNIRSALVHTPEEPTTKCQNLQNCIPWQSILLKRENVGGSIDFTN